MHKLLSRTQLQLCAEMEMATEEVERAQREGQTLIWCVPCCSSDPLALRCWRGASVADEKEMESNVEEYK